MNMTRTLWQIFFCLCGLSAAFVKGGNIKGVINPNDVLYNPLKVYQCENFEPGVKADFNFHDGVIDVEFDLEEDFTDIYQGKFNASKWVDGNWKEGAFNTSNKVCDLLNNYGKEVWRKFREGSTPALPGDCLMEAGHYKITNFEVARKDLTFTVPDTGRFLTKIVILDEFDTELLCIMTEVDVFEK